MAVTEFTDNLRIKTSTPWLTFNDTGSNDPDYRIVNGSDDLHIYWAESLTETWNNGTEVMNILRSEHVLFTTDEVEFKVGSSARSIKFTDISSGLGGAIEFANGDWYIGHSSSAVAGADLHFRSAARFTFDWGRASSPISPGFTIYDDGNKIFSLSGASGSIDAKFEDIRGFDVTATGQIDITTSSTADEAILLEVTGTNGRIDFKADTVLATVKGFTITPPSGSLVVSIDGNLKVDDFARIDRVGASAATLRMDDEDGVLWYVYVDTSGDLQVSASAP